MRPRSVKSLHAVQKVDNLVENLKSFFLRNISSFYAGDKRHNPEAGTSRGHRITISGITPLASHTRYGIRELREVARRITLGQVQKGLIASFGHLHVHFHTGQFVFLKRARVHSVRKHVICTRARVVRFFQGPIQERALANGGEQFSLSSRLQIQVELRPL